MSGSIWKFTLLLKKLINYYIWVLGRAFSLLKDQLKDFYLTASIHRTRDAHHNWAWSGGMIHNVGSFRRADNPFSGGESLWGPTNSFPYNPTMAVVSYFPSVYQKGNTNLLKSKVISSGRFSSKAMSHFSSSPRDSGTGWQCSFYLMPWQPRSLSLHQFWDPKLPFLADWNPRSGINQGLDSTETI